MRPVGVGAGGEGGYVELFARALRGEGDVPVKVKEVAEVLRLIELAMKSSDEGTTLDF